MKKKTQRKYFTILTGKAKLMTGLMMSIFLSTSMLCSAATTVYKMDFNSFQWYGGYVGGASAWNIYAEPSDVTGTIKDISGASTAGITLNHTGDLGDNTHVGYFSNSTGGASWATTDGSLDNTQAVGDYFSSNNSGTPAIFTFGGLTPGHKVSVDLFSAFNASSSAPRGRYSYSIDGGTTYLGFDILAKDGTLVTSGTGEYTYFNGSSQGNTAAQYLNISSLTVGASGTILVKAQDNGNYGEYAVISAMQLTTAPAQGTLISIQ